ncbi:hypothetical protein TcasGA2_TC006999 [Tribolium castaneum]|uniref:PiggyBac transposable element-derived protein domain-containing protein n=1 Tax=Tribolium castaneum TaxID=7070 RepID=D2A341_TRICA|nr:hypothetical protein TcasGA2_TC006999 [Tribolium castaneum]
MVALCSDFNFTVKYRPGDKIKHGDALSRNVLLINNIDDWILSIQIQDPAIKLNINKLKSQDCDQFIKNTYKFVNDRLYRTTSNGKEKLEYRTSGNTKNLKDHLNRFHKNEDVNTSESDEQEEVQAQRDVSSEASSRLFPYELRSMLEAAALLDPRLKTYAFRNPENASQGRVYLKEELAKLQSKRASSQVDSETKKVPTDSRSSSSGIFNFVYERISQASQQSTPQSDSIILLRQYMEMEAINFNSNPIEYWEQQQNLSDLSNLAKRFVSIPATSVASERFKRPHNIRNLHQQIGDNLKNLETKFVRSLRIKKNKSGNITKCEIKAFFGVLLLCGYVPLPRRQMFWEKSKDTRNDLVANAISRDRFEQILTNLQCCDNDHLDKNLDKFTKVRPLFDKLNNNFRKFAPFCETHSVGKSMVPYFGKHRSKQFIKNKSIRYGYKMGATNNAYCIWFEPYHGSKTKVI